MTGEQIDKWIGRAVGLAYVIALIDLLVYVAVVSGMALPFTWRTGLDALLFVALAWGVGRRSLIAAIVLPGYWIVTKVVLWIQFQQVGALLGLVIGGYVFVQGARAVVAARRNRELVDQATRPAT